MSSETVCDMLYYYPVILNRCQWSFNLAYHVEIFKYQIPTKSLLNRNEICNVNFKRFFFCTWNGRICSNKNIFKKHNNEFLQLISVIVVSSFRGIYGPLRFQIYISKSNLEVKTHTMHIFWYQERPTVIFVIKVGL